MYAYLQKGALYINLIYSADVMFLLTLRMTRVFVTENSDSVNRTTAMKVLT